MWFYVKTPGVVRTLEDGSTEKVHSYASRMREMKPLSKVEPSAEMLEDRDKAFTLACRYLGGHDLVEEMVAFDFWKLGCQNEDFKIEMVQVPVLGLRRDFLFLGLVRVLKKVKLESPSWSGLNPPLGGLSVKSWRGNMLHGGVR